jgi:fermentation-respiration switch protein FrsA (DUF1100 family)
MVTVLVLLGLCYGGVLAWLRVNEDRLVFFPDSGPVPLPAAGLGLTVHPVLLSSPDGVSLQAWEIAPPHPDSAATWLLVLHGNAGNLGTPGRAEHARQLQSLGLGVLALDYRGYGESSGTPSEAGTYVDARTAYDYLRVTRGIPAERIVIYGHSLGSAVAVELATSVPAAGLIAEGAFTSAPDLGSEVYPFLPVRLLARNQFNSLARIGRLRMPLLVIHGRDDQTIPIAHGRRLFSAAPEPKWFLDVPGGHDDAYSVDAAAYEAGIRRFLASLH